MEERAGLASFASDERALGNERGDEREEEEERGEARVQGQERQGWFAAVGYRGFGMGAVGVSE